MRWTGRGMYYLGGKSRIARPLAAFLGAQRRPGQLYLEPFVGAGWVFVRMADPKIGSDIHPDLMMLWQMLQEGWEPPDTVTEEMYRWAREDSSCPPHLRAFIGFGCSWGGKWFGGPARCAERRNYARAARDSLLRKQKAVPHAVFVCLDYREWQPHGMMIYCDPPYEGTTGYDGVGRFDWELFWQTMREWSVDNDVFVSSYQAPADFLTVWEAPTRTAMRDREGRVSPRVERLFRHGR